MHRPSLLRHFLAPRFTPVLRGVAKLPLSRRVAVLAALYVLSWLVISALVQLGTAFSSDLGTAAYFIIAGVAITLVVLSYLWFGQQARPWSCRLLRTVALAVCLGAAWLALALIALFVYHRVT